MIKSVQLYLFSVKFCIRKYRDKLVYMPIVQTIYIYSSLYRLFFYHLFGENLTIYYKQGQTSLIRFTTILRILLITQSFSSLTLLFYINNENTYASLVPSSRKPFAKGLLTIFNCVTQNQINKPIQKIIYKIQ